MNISVIVGFLVVCCSLALADSIEKAKTLEDSKIDVKDLIEIDDDKEIPESQRKRDSGYYYSRPSSSSSSSLYDFRRPSSTRIKFPSRQSTHQVRPFNRYGPPNYSTRPQSNKNTGQTQIKVPSLIKNTDFIEESPIASQNDSPFNPNSANYLPPKNQKLPSNSLAGTFQYPHRPSSFRDNHQVNNFIPTQYPQRYNLLQNPPTPQDSSPSDEDLFLQKNAQKIAQLYEAPASNMNYPPYDDFQDSNSGSQSNPNSQFQIIAVDRPTTNQPSEQQENVSQGFSGPIPSYSSGILENPRVLDEIHQSRAKDRIILQLQQALVATHQSQDPASEFLRYAQNYGQTIKNDNSLSSIGTTSQLDQGQKSIPSLGGESIFGASSFGSNNNFPVTYGLPLDSQTPTTTNPPVSISTTSSSSSSSSSGHQPQDNGNNNGINFPFSFPQYNGFVPSTSIPAGANIIPNYGTNFVAPPILSSISPTNFGLPIPIIPDRKPEINPTHDGKPSINIPFNQNIHPIISNNQIFPVVSSPIQPALVNSVFIKPVKPVYPLYYYQQQHHQNIVYPLQKHSLPVSPWNYAPAYSARKSSNI